ncbi:BglII/BstYI family type II restriction endonuclease [Peribacillus frigoritolerans]|uniref:BglII/BstYI family type II restriction endonuclease n=1 Tax=Peribacillus frigoritolerans TaxID=450367 RepID=UPI002417AC2A|nr:BglII/BstYI family type II restriction endonuclease [Peribacillus frigoritolerans]MDG4849579.1 BglII/BstYI family type II restriction endonuclease [Peribacillus frigoritolerans]
MKIRLHSHRNALTILQNEPEYQEAWAEIQHILKNLTDERIIECYEVYYKEKNKSLSTSINKLLKDDFSTFGWQTESAIFQEPQYHDIKGDYWRLDMAKDNISIEVAFNHSTVIAWNLLKPVLASELNHVQKAIQTKLGVIICATQDLKSAGNFDGAVGTFEKFIHHLRPMMNQLSVPLLIIGLEAPSSFRLSEIKVGSRKLGQITYIEDELTIL